MKSISLCLGLVLVACSACSRSDSLTTADQELASIAAVRTELDAAQAARDADRVAATFTDDAVYLPPGEREIIGQELLRTYLRDAYAVSNSSTQSRRVPSDIKVVGEWAFEWGQVETIQPPTGSFDRWVDGKYLHVYQRQLSGTWKISRASYNANPVKTARVASN